MKARDLVRKGESAIVIFTRGDYFDESSTGYWRIAERRTFDRVIVYKRLSTGNEIYTADFAGKEWNNRRKRFIILLSNRENIGVTENNWIEFAGGSPTPVQFINK